MSTVFLKGKKVKSLSRVQLFETPWIVASQEFPRQEYWSGLPFPPPGDLPNPGIEPKSPTSSALAGEFFTTCAMKMSLTAHQVGFNFLLLSQLSLPLL